ncbi:MAG: tRNA (adenosine(37)-N6)-threonylcarbamoyltransferase complex dimerization subunit type 1 TsaB [Deltaproteobacteria bacterium]|nr:tRNA (adenosine(37)-N6)-threonylcarbamoyltransferase complex dimerization subunit type 1 TsaB [Deltaproteobacteria bacterium]
MKVLAISTSSASGSIALVNCNGENDEVAAELASGAAENHSRWLLKSIKALLEGARCSIGEIDLFAVDVGPGSFTGIRVGVSTVKGLAWPSNRKAAGVSTLKALAMNISSERPICPVLDARKGEVYAALYLRKDGRFEELMGESAIKPQALFDRVNELCPGPVVFLGGGLGVYGNEILKNIKGAELAPERLWQIRASNVALLARDSAPVGPEALSPVYLRKSEAELKTKAG